ARGIVFFLIVDGQGEEVLPRLRRLGEGHVGHHLRLAEGGDDRAVGLARNLPRFQRERLVAPLDGFLRHVEHMSFPLGVRPLPAPPYLAAPLPPFPPILRMSPGGGPLVADGGGPYRKTRGLGRGGLVDKVCQAARMSGWPP